jgi:epoxyqueuosine reductase QueG
MEKPGIKKILSSIVENEVSNAQTATRYRRPPVGFAEVKKEDFFRLRETVGKHHAFPDDLLPGAQSMMAFFVPFSREVVNANSSSNYVARDWALAYVETNKLINHICETIVHTLDEAGIEAVFDRPTYDFDRRNLVARWSHKSIAKLAGLGSFGLNQQLITDAGCAGRFGSMLLRTEIEPTFNEARERCLYFFNGSCKLCINRCPVNALKTDGQFDRKACYQYLRQVDEFFSDLPLAEACGKCSVGLPCSIHSSVTTHPG